ncbi:rhodanese-like domain-containing protein [Methylosinus sp. Sm6]|uniref:rhodanese-like domain-containing protein n=1 Tax=Methylosinus sp. Sm6 TaxID=2866948 RepID=UPI001C99F961|nr:rhodanese-like domain-containing protein [Methylosinus sp. Sm6]MBY6242629.1 rhodanese-related sulfurtransferase [Methylosinus sp. Sm6]
MAGSISAHALRQIWREGGEVALFDAREEAPYSRAHPFFAISLPISEIDSRVMELAPRLSATLVVYDDGEGFAERAARRLEELGYADVRLLRGGLSAYGEVGELFRDVNVPSKAFGELVEAIRHTPSLPAQAAAKLIAEEPNLVVVDARRFEEYRAMSIPKGVSTPGGELALRIFDIAPSPDTFILVNCAGRTRSIIGAQTLVDTGIPNRVAALRNGTIGWTLEGLTLDVGQTRRSPPTSASGRAQAIAAARARAKQVGVETIDAARFKALLEQRAERTLYLLDVRTPEEFAAGHVAGFRSAPGGQLVQATDEWVAVRGARIVLYDDAEARALTTAAWLVQLGWETYVLSPDAGVATESGSPTRRRPPLPALAENVIFAAEVAARREDFILVDIGRSVDYRAAHIPGALWAAAAHLERDLATLPSDRTIVLTSTDGEIALDNFSRARASWPGDVRALAGGNAAFGALTTEDERWISAPDDVYKRPYEGTDNASEAMRAYIDWELQLVAQLANDGVANFHVVR